MHSTIVRAQNVFGFFTTVAFAIAALIAASDYLAVRDPRARIEVGSVNVVRGRPHYYSTKTEEYASIKFNLNADLSSLFTWNTKQVFVYVTAEWPANATVGQAGLQGMNEAVIWDSIITSPSADHLSNIKAAALRKLKKSAEGKSIDPSRGKITLKNQKPKYQITSPTSKVAETDDVTLHLYYNVQPWMGALYWTTEGTWGKWKSLEGGVSKKFRLPALKTKDNAKAKTARAST